MKLKVPPPSSSDREQEITALIETLHRAGQRLEDLTAGEVDTVADHDGRVILLRRAQEQFRRSVADKQAAVLNALPANIALLDTRGAIVSVNEAWRRFSSANVLLGPECDIGVDYLAICDRAGGEDAAKSRQAAAGIRSVLDGTRTSFSLEYPCNSPAQQRWFLLTVTPLAEGHPNGAVIMHLDITERRRSEQELLVFGAAIDALADAIYLVDRSSMKFVHINDAACRMMNKTHEELLTLNPWEILGIPRAELEYTYDAMIARSAEPEPLELLRPRADGKQAWVELRRHAQCTEGRWTIVTLVRDITERKRAADDLKAEQSRLIAAQRVAKIGSWQTDLATLSVIWSDETHRIHETDPATFRPTHQAFIALVHPEDRTRVDEAFNRSIDQRAAGLIEHRLLLPDDRIKFVEERWQVLCDEQGKPARAIGTCQDITERKKADAKILRLSRVHALLSGINTAIVRHQNREELFKEICRIAVSEGHFTAARVVELDRKGNARIAATSALDSSLFQKIIDEYNADPEFSENLLALGLRHGKPLISNDVAVDPRMPNRAELTRDGTFAFALLPIIADGRIAGALTLRAKDAGMFDEAELHLLLQVVANLSFALEHIAKESKVRRLTRMNAVLSGIKSLIVRTQDRDDMFRGACQIAVENGKFAMAWIGAVDRSAMKIVPIASAGAEPEFLNLVSDRFSLLDNAPSGNTMSARAVRDKTAIVSNDIRKGPAFFYTKERIERGILSIAVLPLMHADEAVGVLALYATEVGFFDEAEMQLLSELAGEIAFAIEHIDQIRKLARITRMNEMLSSINGAIVRIRDRQALSEEVCRIAVETGVLPIAWVGLVDAPGTQAQLIAFAGRDDGFSQMVRNRLAVGDDEPEEHGLSARAIREKRVVVVNDVAADPVLSRRKAFADRGIKSVAVFPLFITSRVVGVLALHSAQADFFDADEMKLLNEVADNIAFALEHIEKEEKVRRLTRVYAVLSGINSLIVRARDREELFKESCRIAVDEGRFARAWLGIVDPATRHLKMVAAHGGDPQFLRNLETELNKKFLAGTGLVERALATRQPVVSNHAADDPEILLKDNEAAGNIGSIAILPLVIADDAVGVLSLNAASPGFFDEEEIKLLTELAGDIAFAVDHIGKQERLEYLAYYDELTGLANRSLFLERVAQYMRTAVSAGHKLALFFVDLERFRNINDSLGRPAGDALLKQISEWLSLSTGAPNLVARLGADQFAIVLPELKQYGNVTHLLEKKIRLFLEHQYRVNDTDLRISLKVGVALFPNDGADAATLLRNAEAALKKAKSRGEPYLFYKAKMTDKVAGKLTLENQLREAIDREEFVLHYQPKVSLDSGKLTGAEALIRWNDPRIGLVPPGRFIPVLEETGLIQDVGRWALRKAIEDYLRWRAAGLPALRIAVNVSPLQLRSRGFVDEIKRKVGIVAHAAEGLELEITESLIMENVEHSIASLQAIRAMGVTVAIDDFGTGFSSLSYLAKLPVDTLKIDRSFINDMTLSPQGLSLVSTVIILAHSLKLKVVAEGVETEEQSRLLRLLRCDEMQGFLFSKPVPVDIFETRFLAPALHTT